MTMRKVVCGVVVALLMLGGVDDAAAWPFGKVWEKRKAELYARLSRDVTVRVNTRVAAVQRDLHDSLDARFSDEAAKIREQLAANAGQLDGRLAAEMRSIDEAFSTESRALRDRFDSQLQELKKKVDADLAAAAEKAAARVDEESKKTAQRMEAVGENLATKTAAELQRIEKQSAAEFEKFAAATGQRLDADLAKLEARVNEQIVAIANDMKKGLRVGEQEDAPAGIDPAADAVRDR
jgi:hypothetical protein